MPGGKKASFTSCPRKTGYPHTGDEKSDFHFSSHTEINSVGSNEDLKLNKNFHFLVTSFLEAKIEYNPPAPLSNTLPVPLPCPLKFMAPFSS